MMGSSPKRFAGIETLKAPALLPGKVGGGPFVAVGRDDGDVGSSPPVTVANESLSESLLKI